MKIFTLKCHPGTKWMVKVFVHPSRKALHAVRFKMSGRATSPTCEAFAYEFGTSERFAKGLIGEMHFERNNLTNAVIVHECAHTAVSYMCHCRLDLNHKPADEHFAECMEHLVEGTTNGIKMDFRKKTT